MAIVNSAATFPGVGNQIAQVINTAVSQASSPQTIRCPAGSVNLSPAVNRGWLRCKIYNQTVAVTVTRVDFQVADGTNTITIDSFSPLAGIAITATAWLDILKHFLVDDGAGGGATGTLIFAGATFANFVITDTGAGGTAAADVEIAAEP